MVKAVDWNQPGIDRRVSKKPYKGRDKRVSKKVNWTFLVLTFGLFQILTYLMFN